MRDGAERLCWEAPVVGEGDPGDDLGPDSSPEGSDNTWEVPRPPSRGSPGCPRLFPGLAPACVPRADKSRGPRHSCSEVGLLVTEEAMLTGALKSQVTVPAAAHLSPEKEPGALQQEGHPQASSDGQELSSLRGTCSPAPPRLLACVADL